MTALVEATAAAMSRHDGLALVALGSLHLEPNALLIVDRMLALLREGGLDDATVAWSVDLLHQHITATAAEESAYAGRSTTEVGTVGRRRSGSRRCQPGRTRRSSRCGSTCWPGAVTGGRNGAMRVLLNGILATPAD